MMPWGVCRQRLDESDTTRTPMLVGGHRRTRGTWRGLLRQLRSHPGRVQKGPPKACTPPTQALMEMCSCPVAHAPQKGI